MNTILKNQFTSIENDCHDAIHSEVKKTGDVLNTQLNTTMNTLQGDLTNQMANQLVDYEKELIKTYIDQPEKIAAELAIKKKSISDLNQLTLNNVLKSHVKCI